MTLILTTRRSLGEATMKRHTAGFTLVEIMIVVAIIALLAAIAIPNVLRSRTSANESSAIGNIRALISSLEMHRSVNNVYPLDVAANTWVVRMYGTCPGGGGAPDPDFGPPSFCLPMLGGAASRVQGYDYTYAAGAAPGQQYVLTAIPSVVGQTGTRSFRATETGLVLHCTGGVAPDGTGDATIDAAPGACP
jgi:prepilin-type N-terminal cleavage/methylation domain-containing protein